MKRNVTVNLSSIKLREMKKNQFTLSSLTPVRIMCPSYIDKYNLVNISTLLTC